MVRDNALGSFLKNLTHGDRLRHFTLSELWIPSLFSSALRSALALAFFRFSTQHRITMYVPMFVVWGSVVIEIANPMTAGLTGSSTVS